MAILGLCLYSYIKDKIDDWGITYTKTIRGTLLKTLIFLIITFAIKSYLSYQNINLIQIIQLTFRLLFNI